MSRATAHPWRRKDAAGAPQAAASGLLFTPPIGIGLLDYRLRFLQINEALARLTGIPAEIHIGRRIEQVFPEIEPKVMRALHRLVDGEKLIAAAEISRGSTPRLISRPQTWRLSFTSQPDANRRTAVISVIATDITALRSARTRSLHQVAFQELMLLLSTAFVNVPTDHVDPQIEVGLRNLAEFLKIDRALLAQINQNNQFSITHSYSVSEFPEVPIPVLDVAFPWVTSMIRRGEVVRISAKAELPHQAKEEKAWAKSTGMQSQLAIPISIDGISQCALMLSSTRQQDWPHEIISRLRLAGTIFANALTRKRADEDLQRTRENLAHMMRVRTVGQLATSIAHEVNQPLCAMLSNAQAAQRLLAAPKLDVPEILAALADIIADGKRASDVIGRTHEMLKRHDVQFSEHNVNDLITRIKPELDNYAMLRHVELETNLAPELPPILGHAVQIQQVIINLLVNAVDAVLQKRKYGGHISISTHIDSDKHAILIKVADNGIGLPVGNVDHLFEPFFTSKPTGLGMGLSISRTIAQAHSGSIWAQPNPQHGATFYFSLPAQPAMG